MAREERMKARTWPSSVKKMDGWMTPFGTGPTMGPCLLHVRPPSLVTSIQLAQARKLSTEDGHSSALSSSA
eukprot:401983-Prorocentrum_minimum.AAC.1